MQRRCQKFAVTMPGLGQTQANPHAQNMQLKVLVQKTKPYTSINRCVHTYIYIYNKYPWDDYNITVLT